MTQHPTPEQVQTVIDNLKKIEEQANQENRFDIEVSYVNKYDHGCGTVHCVAGWYAVANQEHPLIKRALLHKRCDYKHGAQVMAEHMGLIDMTHLEDYMDNNPDIWGNNNGDEMFSGLDAYNDLDYDSQNPMTIIIQHWQQVKKNLENLAQG